MSRLPSLLNRLLSLSTGALLVACEPPPVVPTQDRRQNVETSRIEGEVLVQGTFRGNAIVSLFDAERLPPPSGTGRPIAFTFVPAEELFGDAPPDFAGPFTAPFSFSLVPPGRYVVQGFIDVDGCLPVATEGCRGPDFNPWISVAGEPNRSDVGGAAVLDATTRALRVIEVGVDRPATGVTVSFASTATVPFDRPVFRAASKVTLVPSEGIKVVELLPNPLQLGPVDQRAPAFVARYVDANNDGVPDDADGDGQADLWPKVVVRKLAEGGIGLADENDLDRNGLLDPTGVDYPHASGPADGKPDAVVLAAAIERDELVTALNGSGGLPVPMPRLKLVVRPLALDASNPKSPQPLATVPPGRYAVTLIQFTGQTWRIPNELTPGIGSALGVGAEDPSQTVVVEVP
jgi:hypothetical protein